MASAAQSSLLCSTLCRKSLSTTQNYACAQIPVQKSTLSGTKPHHATGNGAEKHPFGHQTALRHKKWCRKAPILAPNSARGNFRCRKTLFPAPNCTPPQEMVQKSTHLGTKLSPKQLPVQKNTLSGTELHHARRNAAEKRAEKKVHKKSGHKAASFCSPNRTRTCI